MYAVLPGLLDSNPFSESGQLRMPAGVSQILDVLKEALHLLNTFQVHSEITSQLLTYLFFFTNASLFNTLMERGENMHSTLFWGPVAQAVCTKTTVAKTTYKARECSVNYFVELSVLTTVVLILYWDGYFFYKGVTFTEWIFAHRCKYLWPQRPAVCIADKTRTKYKLF